MVCRCRHTAACVRVSLRWIPGTGIPELSRVQVSPHSCVCACSVEFLNSVAGSTRLCLCVCVFSVFAPVSVSATASLRVCVSTYVCPCSPYAPVADPQVARPAPPAGPPKASAPRSSLRPANDQPPTVSCTCTPRSVLNGCTRHGSGGNGGGGRGAPCDSAATAAAICRNSSGPQLPGRKGGVSATKAGEHTRQMQSCSNGGS